jgi:acyl-CoA hydrolase
MEIEVVVEAENILAGTRLRTSKAHLVYVALDDDAHPKPVPPLTPTTDEERARWDAAVRRRTARLAH